MKTKPILFAVFAIIGVLLACAFGQDIGTAEVPAGDGTEISEISTKVVRPPLPPPSGDALDAADIEYLGAFRLPGGDEPPLTFAYGGNAMTFNPDNNSLFISGHDRANGLLYVLELYADGAKPLVHVWRIH